MNPSRPVTAFQKSIYKIVSTIPPSRVATYAWVAAKAGCGSPRAVGQALRRNPFAPMVPCHRVVASDGSLGGFYGQTSGPQWVRKEHLLRSEGVGFDSKGRVNPECLLH